MFTTTINVNIVLVVFYSSYYLLVYNGCCGCDFIFYYCVVYIYFLIVGYCWYCIYYSW